MGFVRRWRRRCSSFAGGGEEGSFCCSVVLLQPSLRDVVESVDFIKRGMYMGDEERPDYCLRRVALTMRGAFCEQSSGSRRKEKRRESEDEPWEA